MCYSEFFLLTLEFLFSIALRTDVIANLVIFSILFLTSIILALIAKLVAKLIISGISSSIFLS